MSTSTTSSGEHDDRFETLRTPCEWIEAYRPGKFHPTHPGDTFKDGQYKIIRKLGYGSYSTVWLARDLRASTYIALKILVSKITPPVNEVHMLHHIAQTGSAEEIARHFVQLLDEFQHHGPNGVHTCLVFEPMGPSVLSMVEELPQFKDFRWGMKVRYPFWMAKKILKEALQALAVLHKHGIAHGDPHLGNMLFSLTDISDVSEDELHQPTDEHSISPPVRRLDGTPDEGAPRYLCVAKPLAHFTDHSESLTVKLSDLGGAYFIKDPPAKISMSLILRPPELFLTGSIDKSLDVWAFGCLVFELVTGRPLFLVPYGPYHDDDHLLQLNALLGPLPDEFFDLWKNHSLFFTADKKLFNDQLGAKPEDEPSISLNETMEEVFDRVETGLSDEDACVVKALVRRILQYDPRKRPSLEEILNDPFFS